MSAKYEKAALKAAELAAEGAHPTKAWETAVAEVFPDSPASQDKGCPKSAFLGLAGLGAISKVPAGVYTTSKDNKRYAELALNLLRTDPTLANDPKEMWRRVMNGTAKAHNSQMHVVAALWKSGKFVGQDQKSEPC